MPAVSWAAFHGVIGSVGFNDAQQSDLGNECIKMTEAQAALEPFADDLQVSDVSLALEALLFEGIRQANGPRSG